jgi:hypothetical protein
MSAGLRREDFVARLVARRPFSEFRAKSASRVDRVLARAPRRLGCTGATRVAPTLESIVYSLLRDEERQLRSSVSRGHAQYRIHIVLTMRIFAPLLVDDEKRATERHMSDAIMAMCVDHR